MNVWKILVGGTIVVVTISQSLSQIEYYVSMRNAVTDNIKKRSTDIEAKTGKLNAENNKKDATIYDSSMKSTLVNSEKNNTTTLLRDTQSSFDHTQSLHSFYSADTHNVVISYINNTDLGKLGRNFFNGKTCSDLLHGKDLAAYNQHTTLVNVSFSCSNLFNNGMGTGNFLSVFYGLRMVAHVLGTNTDVMIQCSDAFEMKKSLVLPWVMGKFPRLQHNEQKLRPSIKEACSDYYSPIPLGYLMDDIRFEMRRMAIAMVGIPSLDHPSAAWARENLWPSNLRTNKNDNIYQLPTPQQGDVPLFPNVEMDDAMLHFRCGDLINSNHPSFGFMKFGSFSRHLSPNVRSIGIATQPFDNFSEQQRDFERYDSIKKRCKQVVTAFVQHLEEKFPNATIRVHNGPNETIALTFARMVMANQTVVGISTFGVFPAVSTFGTGYIRKPDYAKAVNRWLLNMQYDIPNVELIEEPKIMALDVKLDWGENGTRVIEWFQNYSMPY